MAEDKSRIGKTRRRPDKSAGAASARPARSGAGAAKPARSVAGAAKPARKARPEAKATRPASAAKAVPPAVKRASGAARPAAAKTAATGKASRSKRKVASPATPVAAKPARTKAGPRAATGATAKRAAARQRAGRPVARRQPIHTAKYGIGEVVRHRFYPFRGVVFDIDPVFANTEEWWHAIPPELRPRRDQPFYHLLAENDETEYIAYVSEQNLLPDETGAPLRHPQVAEMFVEDDDGRLHAVFRQEH